MSDTTTTAPATRTIDGAELPVAGTWAIDLSHSSVNFKVKHLGVSKTRGRFTQFGGGQLDAVDRAGGDGGGGGRVAHLGAPRCGCTSCCDKHCRGKQLQTQLVGTLVS